MKKNNILFATCLLGAFAFSSCEKNLYDESKQSEKEIKMTDLNIPEDFQWNLTQVSKGTTIANTQTKVSLFLDEKCSKDEKVATIPVYNKAINLPLSLPTYVKTIYAQYQSKSGKMITKSVAVNANGSYTLNIPDAIEAIPTRAITRDNNKKDDDYNIEDDIKYNNLGLVITDEQHRFGVNQRNNLRNKGNMPDVLYMSATPIPRTYALTIYGDMDISIINTMPSGRKKIITKVFDNSDIKKVLVKIKQELDLGHQIYIVSPLIEDSEEEMEDTKKLEKKFKLAFKNYNIGVIHGKLSPKEKNKVMDDFVNKKIDILISTTVIEVGVDVKNATMIVIFDAYKFGLATLHQLRGRVGRNSEQSYCVLMTNRETERLNIMENVSDGFTLAEEDLKLRGSGDLFGIKQSGDMSFKLANIQKDYELLIKAKADSEEVLDNIDKYEVLKNMLKESINMD